MRSDGAMVLLIALAALESLSAEEQVPPLYRQLRYDEECSYLRSFAGTDLCDPIQYVPLNDPDA